MQELQEYYDYLVQLSAFMIQQINERPENIVNNAVIWPRVIADVHLLYDGPFDDDMLVDAIILIQEAGKSMAEGAIPVGVTIH